MRPSDFPMKEMEWYPRLCSEPSPDDWFPIMLQLRLPAPVWVVGRYTHTPGLYRVWEDVPVTFDQNLSLLAEVGTRICVYGNPATNIIEVGVHDSLNIHPQFTTHWHNRYEVRDWPELMTKVEECYAS